MSDKIRLSLWSFLMIFPFLAGFSQEKEMKKAMAAFDDLQYQTAAELYKSALEKTGDDSLMTFHAQFMLAECYRMMNDPDFAEPYYRDLERSGYGESKPILYLRYADVLRTQGAVAEAREQYRKYLRSAPKDPEGTVGLKSCDWVLGRPGRAQVNVYNLSAINTAHDDFAPAFADASGNSLLFTSNRPGTVGKYTDQWSGYGFSDLYTTTLSGSQWSVPQPFDALGIINTEIHEGSAVFNADLSALYFTRCTRSDEKMRYCQVLKSAKKDGLWQEPVVLLSDTAANMGQPALTTDGLSLYFSSDRKGGAGGNDLWKVTRPHPDSAFGKPVSPGPGINTPGEELFPRLFHDTLLYFASDGHVGYGGLDIYQSRMTDGAWGKPENLLWPVNSGYDDFGIAVIVPGEEGCFTSNRRNGAGADDLYRFTRRTMLFTLSGHIKDLMTLLPLENAVVMLISPEGDTAFAQTDTRGSYHFDTTRVREYSDYSLVFRKDNYFSNKDEISTRPYRDDHNFKVDVLLEPIPEKPIVLPDILYALDDWRLQPQYEDSLMQLVQLLRDNENLVIELRSHTDSRASYEYNDTLSQKRAQSVVDFLILQGIEPGRLVARGYGERIFRVLNKDITREGYTFRQGTEITDQFVYALPTKDIQEAAFQLNRRTEFAVLRKDYKPSGQAVGPAPVIQIVSDSTRSTVDFTVKDDGRIIVMLYLNDYGAEAFLDEGSPESLVNESFVIELLRKGAIDRNDFNGNFDEIMVDGRIVEGALVTMDKVRLGGIVLDGSGFRVMKDGADTIIIGGDLLSKMPDYSVDEMNKQLIFK